MKILELFKKHNIDELKIKELLGYATKFSCEELFQLELEKQNMYHSLKTKIILKNLPLLNGLSFFIF